MKRINCISQKHDLIIVMLNPGSCGNITELKNIDDEIDVELDPTLKRIKKLFENCPEINWIKIINLSDIKNKNSNEFLKKIKELNKKGIKNHSIFDKSRLDKLKEHINKNDLVILAFGTNKWNTILANQAIVSLKEIIKSKIINENKKARYYHPLVWNAGYKWIEETAKIINGTH